MPLSSPNRRLSLRPSVSEGPLSLAEFGTLAADLLDAIERNDRFTPACALLNRVCGFDNFIVYLFKGSEPPVLLGTSVPEKRLHGQMADFVAGLFLLDPFVLATDRGLSGLLRLRDIAPEGFHDSEFYHHHYRYTDVCDELRYVIPIDRRRVVHVFVERETGAELFADSERARLMALTPLISSFVVARFKWIDRSSARDGDRPGNVINLQAVIDRMAGGVLTTREREVVEWMLKGHSARSIAGILGIEEGTVTNHKRNIYFKLEIHSMAQLFDAFLRSLS